jgi:hypothetical protein
VVVIENDDGKMVVPDEVEYTGVNTLEVDLGSYGAIAGTWQIRVLNAGGTLDADAILAAGKLTAKMLYGGL